jgi:hypothetical protein
MVYFQTKNSKVGKILQGLRLKNVEILHDHLEYFKEIKGIL